MKTPYAFIINGLLNIFFITNVHACYLESNSKTTVSPGGVGGLVSEYSYSRRIINDASSSEELELSSEILNSEDNENIDVDIDHTY